MGLWKKIKHAAKKAGDAVQDGAKAAGGAAQGAAGTVTDAATKAADTSTHAWDAASDDARAMATAVESGGLTITAGILEGAQAAEQWTEKGGEYAVDGLVKVGEYLDARACDIALGAALAGAFAGYKSSGAEDATFGSIVAVCVVGTANEMVMQTEACAAAAALAVVLWEIPQVRRAVGGDNKKLFTDVLAYVIYRAIKYDPKKVAASGGQFLVGVLIAIVTSLVCEGTLPGGFKVWQGTYRPHS